KLEKVAPPGKGPPESLPFHEIAVDGLALGGVSERQEVELWPGNRSDGLVQAPKAAGGEYLRADERKPPRDALSGNAGDRRYLARVIIDGDPSPMDLPQDGQVKGFRPPSLRPQDVTGRQEAKYAITLPDIRFTINGTPYDPSKPRVLTLGAV